MKTAKKQPKKRLNWGTGLTIAIVLFTTGTLGMVGFIISLNFHMVSDNHYEKAVNYQQHINRVEQAGALASPVEIELNSDREEIHIFIPVTTPGDNISGNIELYRPDNSAMDQLITLSPDEDGFQQIPAQNLAKGKWLVKVSWTAAGENYFIEKSLFI